MADSGIYSETNMRRFKEAKAVVEMGADKTEWQDWEDGQTRLPHAHDVTAARARAALVVVRTEQGEACAQATLKRQVAKAERSWKQKRLQSLQQAFCL